MQFQKKQLEKQYQKLLQEHQFNLEIRKLKGFPLPKSVDLNSDIMGTGAAVMGDSGYNLPQIRSSEKMA